jgi:hypothetical protein
MAYAFLWLKGKNSMMNAHCKAFCTENAAAIGFPKIKACDFNLMLVRCDAG